MTSSVLTDARRPNLKDVFSKVPEVTLFFWIIKVLCTTIGETAADFLNVNLNLGLSITSVIMGVLLAVALFVQFKTKKYTPVVYWVTVMFISVFGTLVTDNLVTNFNVPLETTTILFTIALAATFVVWYVKEKTLSIHSIFTRRREAFYWLAILFTFALGTASGDLMAEGLGLGYSTTGIIIAGLIAVFAIGWRMGLNAILSFWFIYILTRPLGASIGDFLTQSPADGGIGLGATTTSLIFVVGIILCVAYLTHSRRDVVRNPREEERADEEHSKHAFVQLAVVIVLLLTVSIGGYLIRHHQLQQNAAASAAASSASGAAVGPLGDLSKFNAIAQAMQAAVKGGDWATANSRTNDLEHAWDVSQAQLKPMNSAKWTQIDGDLDTVFRAIRAVHPNQQAADTALQKLLVDLQSTR